MKDSYFYKKPLSNIYKKPNIFSEVTSQILYGEKFKIISRNKSWVKIKALFDNYTGYIKNKYYTKDHQPTHKIFTLKAMFVAGILMAAPNLLFTVLAWSDKSELLFAVAVIFDDIAAAFATVAFVAFISLLVDRTYTATQYALLASIGTAGRTTLASSSGALVDWLNGDWGVFFIITAVMVIPSLICLWLIKDKLKLHER